MGLDWGNVPQGVGAAVASIGAWQGIRTYIADTRYKQGHQANLVTVRVDDDGIVVVHNHGTEPVVELSIFIHDEFRESATEVLGSLDFRTSVADGTASDFHVHVTFFDMMGAYWTKRPNSAAVRLDERSWWRKLLLSNG